MFDGTTWSAATNPVSHAVQAFTGLTRVGSDGGLSGRWFNGSLDEAAIYNTALTQTQLRTHALSGFGVTNLTYRLVGAASGSGPSLGIIWPAGTLHSATNVMGPWTAVSGATLPYYEVPINPAAPSVFFKAQ